MSGILIFFLFLGELLLQTLATTTKKFGSLSQQSTSERNPYLYNNNNLLTSLLELQLMENGPIEELFQAIDSFNNQLDVQKQQKNEQFERITELFLFTKENFYHEITKIKLELSTGKNKVENVLTPQHDQLEEQLIHINGMIEMNKQIMEEEALEVKTTLTILDNNLATLKQNQNQVDESFGIIQMLEEKVKDKGNFEIVDFSEIKTKIFRLKLSNLAKEIKFAPIIAQLATINDRQYNDNLTECFVIISDLFIELLQLVKNFYFYFLQNYFDQLILFFVSKVQ